MLRVGSGVNFNFGLKIDQKPQTEIANNFIQAEASFVKPAIENIKANFLTFTADAKVNALDTTSVAKFLAKFEPDTTKIWDKSIEVAKKHNSKQVTSVHLLAASLQNVVDTLEKRDYENSIVGVMPFLTIASEQEPEVFVEILRNRENIRNEIVNFLKLGVNVLENQVIAKALPKSPKGPENVSEELKTCLATLNDKVLPQKNKETINENMILVEMVKRSMTSQESKDLSVKVTSRYLTNTYKTLGQKIRNLIINVPNPNPNTQV